MSDQLAPSVGMVIDATGKVTYDFDGHIRARGLDLDAGDNASPPADRKVRWIDANGVVVADLAAYRTAPSQTGLAVLNKGADSLFAEIGTLGDDGLGATIYTQSQTAAGGRSCRVQADPVDLLLLNQSGASAFLQLAAAGAAKRKINFGVGQVVWDPGTSAASAPVTVPHGLAVAPQFVGVQLWVPDNFSCKFPITAADAAGFTTYGRGDGPPGSIITQNFIWVAIG